MSVKSAAFRYVFFTCGYNLLHVATVCCIVYSILLCRGISLLPVGTVYCLCVKSPACSTVPCLWNKLLHVGIVFCLWVQSVVREYSLFACGYCLLFVGTVCCLWVQSAVCGTVPRLWNQLLPVGKACCLWTQSLICCHFGTMYRLFSSSWFALL